MVPRRPKKARKRRKKRRPRYGSSCHKQGMHKSSKLGRDVFYRSSWEKLFFEYLDKNDDVITYEVESLRLPYVYGRSKKVKWYVPDVLVHYSKRTELVEIKPSRFAGSVKVKAKIAAAQTYCKEKGMQFKLLTEVELADLGLLGKAA